MINGAHRLILNSAGVEIYSTTVNSSNSPPYILHTALDDQNSYTWKLRAHIALGNTWTDWASAPFGIVTYVSVNLATNGNVNVDDTSGLKRPDGEPCDGLTIPQTLNSTGLRKNRGKITGVTCGGHSACTDAAPCQYIYFDVDNQFISAENHYNGSVDVKLRYLNHKEDPDGDWADYFCIQYKKIDQTGQISNAHKCITVPVDNSNTWSTRTLTLDNVYFRNNLASNDFRIACRTNSAR